MTLAGYIQAILIIASMHGVIGNPINSCRLRNGVYRAYDIEKETCCGGALYPNAKDMHCCRDSGEMFNISRNICCGSAKANRANATGSYDCCRGDGAPVIYNVDDDTCCSGVVHSKTSTFRGIKISLDGFCCGTKYYTDRDKQCCKNNENVALSKPYSSRDQQCCNGNLYPLDNTSSRCCDKELYNPMNQEVCCEVHGRMQVLSYHGYWMAECCANAPGGVINSATHVCIDGQPYETNCPTIRPQDVNVECCAGRFRYNTTKQQCCEGQVMPLDVQCCLGQVVSSGQVCCSARFGLVPRSEPDQDACCETLTSFRPYNSLTQTCVNGFVQEMDLCGRKQYNTHRSVCCNGRLRRRRDGYACCNQTYYPIKYKTCCNGRLLLGAQRQCTQ